MASFDLERALQNATSKLRSGKPGAAAKAAQAALKKFPNEPRLLDVAGTAYQEAGDPKSATPFLLALHKLMPQDAGLRFKLGVAVAHAGNTAMADKLFASWIATEPENPTYHFLNALKATAGEDHAAAEQAATAALTHDPQMERALAIRGLARYQLGKFDAALEDFEAADQLAPDTVETLLNLGLCLRALRRTQDAITALRRCVALAPANVEPKINLGEVLEHAGDLGEAREIYLDVLATDPDNWQALSRVAALNTRAQNETFLEVVRRAHRAVRKNSDDAITSSNVLAGVLASVGNAEEAARFYARSNALAASKRPYDPANAVQDFERTAALFAKRRPHGTPPQSQTPRPLFIIGQPRSGTTLLEVMLSAHPRVLGLGELGAIEDVAIAALARGSFDPAAHAQAYRAELPRSAADFEAFIDKTPVNYRFVGFLADAFPDARFIHLARDPREVALSMWKIHFKGAFYSYASRLDWMAHAANLYRRYMDLWAESYSDRIAQVHYRDIVQNPEQTVKALAAFCDLDWVDAMAAPEKSTATIETASILQARKPVHRKSLNAWTAHQDMLTPFVQGLDPALWPEVFEG